MTHYCIIDELTANRLDIMDFNTGFAIANPNETFLCKEPMRLKQTTNGTLIAAPIGDGRFCAVPAIITDLDYYCWAGEYYYFFEPVCNGVKYNTENPDDYVAQGEFFSRLRDITSVSAPCIIEKCGNGFRVIQKGECELR